MKKNYLAIAALGLTAALLMMGCGKKAEETAAVQAETTAEAAGTESVEETSEAADAKTEENAEEKASGEAEDEAASEGHYIDDTVIRVGSLKGPTTMGLVNMMADGEADKLPYQAEFTMAAAADELSAKIASGDIDIALIPANLAAVLYNKTEGGISVLNINTLGVLYGVTGDESVKSLADLKGKTVYMTGQGTTPEFAFNYILAQNGLTEDVKIEFKSEATEIAALLKEDPTKIAVLPQPFATVVQQQTPEVKEIFDLTEEWKKCPDSGNSQLVTGVTVVRNDFMKEHEALVAEFVLEQQESVQRAAENLDETAELVAKYGIIEKAPIAKLALPKCSLSCITGSEMKDALSGYLSVLYAANPKSVGGTLPADGFYAFVEAK